MCTVIVHVDATPDEPVRILAIRDEDPERAWDPLGAWWPDTHPGVLGVRDARAGGAWLAADPAARRLAVVLNRADLVDVDGSEIGSRGNLVLAAVAGDTPSGRPRTHGFNLVEVSPGRARVTSWDGTELSEIDLAPGTHMIAHDDVDDDTPRIVHWLDAFRAADERTGGDRDPDAWWHEWMRVLEASTSLGPLDDRAIIRDNRPLGYPTLSLLACVASVSPTGLEVRYGAFDRPGEWNALTLEPARPEQSALPTESSTQTT